MGYRWKPSASQKRAFAEKMQNPAEQAAYMERKAEKAQKRRDGSSFDYGSAGGYYVATKAQHDFAIFDRTGVETIEQENACNQVAYSYSCNEKIHHDYIHIVNELIRAKK